MSDQTIVGISLLVGAVFGIYNTVVRRNVLDGFTAWGLVTLLTASVLVGIALLNGGIA